MHPPAKSSKESIRVFCLTCFLFVIFVFFIFSSSNALAGSIGGSLTDAATGAPLSAMTIEIMDAYLDYRASTATDINGDYIFDNLPAGHYLVRASSGGSGYVAEFYQSALNYYTATLIDLQETHVLSGINILLETGRDISGRITDQDTTLPAWSMPCRRKPFSIPGMRSGRTPI